MDRHLRRAFWTVALAVLAGCANYREQLDRADGHYRAARYEAAITNLEDLEPDVGRLDQPDRVRFQYILGMSHARLNHRGDARHWLAMAREAADGNAALLPGDMQTILDRTLREVDWVLNPATEDRAGAAARPNGSVPSAGTSGGVGTAAPPGR